MTFHTEPEKNNPEIHVEAQKAANSQSNPKQKMLEVSQYLISNYTTKP
jgi:hypothetical protein